MNEQGLWYEKPCPAGSFCPNGVTTAPEATASGYWTAQGATAGTANECEEGYKCEVTEGNTGPYEEGCPLGEWTGADVTTGCSTAECESGKHCGQGVKEDCPEGFFCETGTAEY